MVAGAGGGVSGPMGCYEALAKRLAESGVTAIRVDYRLPNRIDDCNYDVERVVDYLKTEHQINSFLLLGWSFGGAIVFQELAKNPNIVGGATIASQTYGATDPARKIDPTKSVLLIHGTGDTCLSYQCSKQLHSLASVPKERKRLVLYEGEGHGIERSHEKMTGLIHDWTLDTLGC